jgi:cytochrome c oxidase cbb3-type subunit 3
MNRVGLAWAHIFITTCFVAQVCHADAAHDAGKKVYDYYCYQCHGYSGDANTLASTYLNPAPRNFTSTPVAALKREKMLHAVTHGRDKTAMVSFTSVLSEQEIENVVDYIRQAFMHNKSDYRYHTEANGWSNHQRYETAFPFANGSLALDTPWENLDESQQAGKKLFMQACISCHDRATVMDEGPAWELRPLSYPRKHYSHRVQLDTVSGASPYALHDNQPDNSKLSVIEKHGAELFAQNCAFCHGADATGKNWIGHFLEPHARDLTQAGVLLKTDDQLLAIIRHGLDGTSMPAWKQVLSDDEIRAIITYLKREVNNTDTQLK